MHRERFASTRGAPRETRATRAIHPLYRALSLAPSPRKRDMQAQTENKPYDDINVTPMLDLAYVLLVIFIIMTTASVQGIKVNLPKASDTPTLAKPKTKAITIRDDGQIFLDAYPVTMEELELRLRGFKSADPALPVIVKGDAA